MYENSILHKAAIVPLQESDFVAKFESN